MFSKYTLNIAAWLFLPTTLLSLIFAGYFWFDSLNRQTEWSKAEATVSRIEWKESSNSHGEQAPFAYAIFTFTTADGSVVEVPSKTAASEKPLYNVGDTQWVIYPPNAPELAEEATFLVQFLLPLMLTIETLFIGLITALLFFISHRAQRKATLPPLPGAGS